MITSDRRYLNQFSVHGAATLDLANTEHIKTSNPNYDRFLYTDHKHQVQYPNSRHLSTNPSTYML